MRSWTHVLIFSLAAGCSAIEIKSKNKIPISFTPLRDHVQEFKVKTRREYFLWGSVPGNQDLYVDKIVASRGIESLAQVRVYEFSSGADTFWTIVSLGLYSPKTYVIEGKTEIR